MCFHSNVCLPHLGLPRLRLPSRNWLIFLSITGSFASAVIYDKYQTRRIREKWCGLVSHIPNEYLDPKQMPRKMTVYLAAPPGDGLRSAREHFHTYVKPVLVAAAMDWDVVEGRKEGDVRYKTAERIRKKRRRNGEGEPMSEEELENIAIVDGIRDKNGTKEWDGIGGDLVIGRNTWKEYLRGIHEGWLGPVDEPKPLGNEGTMESDSPRHTPGQSSLGDAAVKAAANTIVPPDSPISDSKSGEESSEDDAPSASGDSSDPKADEKKEEDKPKPRHPPPYIQAADYASATASTQIPEVLGPSIGIQFPHILGFRNTPIRIWRFLNRRHLADSIGRDVAAAVLASNRPYSTAAPVSDETESSAGAEQLQILKNEERNWWKTTFNPRKEHEESVWIEDITLDERIANRLRAFQLTAEDEDRAKRIADGSEKVEKVQVEET